MEEQYKLVQNGSHLYCPNGSHLAMWDDQKYYEWRNSIYKGKDNGNKTSCFFDVMC
jgi:hypothetical protein